MHSERWLASLHLFYSSGCHSTFGANESGTQLGIGAYSKLYIGMRTGKLVNNAFVSPFSLEVMGVVRTNISETVVFI